jgi:uncharacterized membrane protein
MGLFRFIKVSMKKYFLSGLLVTVPLIITYLVLKALFGAVDGILSPIIIKLLGRDIPGLGIIATLILILIAGVLTRGFIGSSLIKQWDKIMAILPLVRTVYSAAKQLVVTIVGEKTELFQRVVIIPYPRQGIFTLGFAVNEVSQRAIGLDAEHVAVFIPSSPTPFTGYVVIVNKDEIYPTTINVEEAVKFLVSGGIALPQELRPSRV